MPAVRANIVVALLGTLLVGCLPANAFMVIYDEDDSAPDAQQFPAQQAQVVPNNQRPAGPSPLAGRTISSGMFLSTGQPSMAFHQAPADLELIGYWVGNIHYKVGKSALTNGLFLVNEKGQVSELAQGVINPGALVIPFNNALTNGFKGTTPVAGQQAQPKLARSGGRANYANSGLLTPTIMAARTMIVDGKPMVVGGPVICEYIGPVRQSNRREYNQQQVAKLPAKSQLSADATVRSRTRSYAGKSVKKAGKTFKNGGKPVKNFVHSTSR
jgi:hypothetical protein